MTICQIGARSHRTNKGPSVVQTGGPQILLKGVSTMPIPYTPRQAAMWFARQGHAVLPLHSLTEGRKCTCGDSECHSPGKHPFAAMVLHGVKDATTDEHRIRSWFDEAYWINYGVATDRLFVVDVDTKHDGIKKWFSLHSQPTHSLPHTWQVRTGSGGLHVFFVPPAKARSGDLDKGIQLKSAGGYVVGTGCRHASGKLYHWQPQCSPTDTPLAEVPSWLLSLIKTRTYLGKVTPPHEWRRIAGAVAQDGERQTILARLAGHLIANPLNDPLEIRELLLGWNRGRCDPPLPDREVVGLVERLCERERNKDKWL
jgi:Bifunctional DNA primase/polymerase, N-terminal